MTQLHVRPCTSVSLQKAPTCQNSSLWVPQALWEMHRAKLGAPVFGGAEVLGRTGRAHAMPAPGEGSFTPPCTWTVLQNMVPSYAVVVLALSFCWVWAPGLQQCVSPPLSRAVGTKAQRCTKQPGALTPEMLYSWRATAISLSLYFFHAHSSPWLKIRQTCSTVKIKIFLVHIFANAFFPPKPVYKSL